MGGTLSKKVDDSAIKEEVFELFYLKHNYLLLNTTVLLFRSTSIRLFCTRSPTGKLLHSIFT